MPGAIECNNYNKSDFRGNETGFLRYVLAPLANAIAFENKEGDVFKPSSSKSLGHGVAHTKQSHDKA